MTLSEIAEEVARRVGADPTLAWGFLQEAVQVMVETVDRGDELKLRGVGALRWIPVKRTVRRDLLTGEIVQVAEGWKLHFYPSKKFRGRRHERQRGRGNDKAGGSAG